MLRSGAGTRSVRLGHGPSRLRVRRAPSRRLSSSSSDVVAEKKKSYMHTLLLPRPPILQWSDPALQAEEYGPRTTWGVYAWQWENRKDKELFILHDGPPYANGNLHIGHAVNKILKDIINRFQVLQGKRVHYMPGWDCHGLPIENKVLKELAADPNSLPANRVRDASRAMAISQIAIQREEFQKMQIMADWSEQGTYRTLDHNYEIRQLRLFQKMVGKGLINRRFRPIWWSPASRTALAETELQYEPAHQSRSVYVCFDIPKSGMSPAMREVVDGVDGVDLQKVELLVWTTTPWTLPANMAVAVHEDLDYVLAQFSSARFLLVGADALQTLPHSMRETEPMIVAKFKGSQLVGTTYRHPFLPLEGVPLNPVFAAPYVKADSGTGLVHCAPGHGSEDYFAMRAAGLLKDREILSPVNYLGRFSPEVFKCIPHWSNGGRLMGKPVLEEGTDIVLELLKEWDSLVAVRTVKHKYPYDWKTKTPVITRATSQWFANIDDVKEAASNALDSVQFHPEQGRTRLESFLRERSEWCISRQRTWGVPIPALHDVTTGESFLTVETLDHIISVLDKKGVAHWWDGPIEDFIPPSLADRPRREDLAKGTDTMDVWFDSGTSWSLLSNLHGEEQPDGPRTADVCLEGSDQHRGWFQSLLLTRIISAPEGQQDAPYKTVITHGFVMDEQGKKMSKSDGNVISPIVTIEGGENSKLEPAYGADVLRLWTASSDYVHDMAVGQNILKQAFESLRKLRNSARFMLGVIMSTEERQLEPVKRENMGLVERYMMDQLHELVDTCRQAYSAYQFHRVVHSLTDFATTKLSALYLDMNKDCLYTDSADNKQRRAIVTVMKEIIRVYKSLLAPITPLLAEELHEGWNPNQTASVFMEPWPTVDESWRDHEARGQMELLLTLRSTVLSLLEKARNDKNLKSSLEAAVYIAPLKEEHPVISVLANNAHLLKTLFIVSDAEIYDLPTERAEEPTWVYSEEVSVEGCPLVISVRPSPWEKCPRCWTYTKTEPDTELCKRCTDVTRPE